MAGFLDCQTRSDTDTFQGLLDLGGPKLVLGGRNCRVLISVVHDCALTRDEFKSPRLV